jgi:hypothetical protein
MTDRKLCTLATIANEYYSKSYEVPKPPNLIRDSDLTRSHEPREVDGDGTWRPKNSEKSL